MIFEYLIITYRYFFFLNQCFKHVQQYDHFNWLIPFFATVLSKTELLLRL